MKNGHPAFDEDCREGACFAPSAQHEVSLSRKGQPSRQRRDPYG